MSNTTKGTELWDEVKAQQEQGEPGPAERVAQEWEALSPEEQIAATKAGATLWNKVVVRQAHENPEPEL